MTGGTVEMAYVDQGYTGPNANKAAQQHALRQKVVKHLCQKRFRPVARCWVVERSFAWAVRFRRLARDHERLGTTLKGIRLLALATLTLKNLANTLT